MFENWKRIFYAFQEDHAVNDMYHLSKSMMEKACTMLEYSIDRLRNRTSSGEALDIYAEDKKLNELEVEVRRRLFVYQAFDRPDKNHQAVLVLSLISHDIERIGDYSKNVFQLSERYKEGQKFGKYDEKLKKIEELILAEFRRLCSYFEEFEEVIHKEVGVNLTSANEMIESCLKELQDAPENSGLDEKTDITLVLYLRFMKRTSSHLRNITSSYFNPVDRIGFKLETPKA